MQRAEEESQLSMHCPEELDETANCQTMVTESKTDGPLDDAVGTTINYLSREPRYQHEKPYELMFDSGGAIPQTNMIDDPRSVYIKNFRPLQDPQNLEEYGFAVRKVNCPMRSADFDDRATVEKLYYPAVEKVLWQSYPNASQIKILEHQVVNQNEAVLLDANFYRFAEEILNFLKQGESFFRLFSLQPLRTWVSDLVLKALLRSLLTEVWTTPSNQLRELRKRNIRSPRINTISSERSSNKITILFLLPMFKINLWQCMETASMVE